MGMWSKRKERIEPFGGNEGGRSTKASVLGAQSLSRNDREEVGEKARDRYARLAQVIPSWANAGVGASGKPF